MKRVSGLSIDAVNIPTISSSDTVRIPDMLELPVIFNEYPCVFVVPIPTEFS